MMFQSSAAQALCVPWIRKNTTSTPSSSTKTALGIGLPANFLRQRFPQPRRLGGKQEKVSGTFGTSVGRYRVPRIARQMGRGVIENAIICLRHSFTYYSKASRARNRCTKVTLATATQRRPKGARSLTRNANDSLLS